MSEEVKLIDFTKMELLRGKTPENIKNICFDLCKSYLSGVWLKLSIDDIEVNRISGGLTNQLYYCGLNKEVQSVDSEPKEVAIQLYGEKHFNNLDNDGNERLTDVIIALMCSINGLGPKTFGIFPNGKIQQYYKHKQFRVEQQKDPKLVEELAAKLAKIHSMDVPIKKTGNWVFDLFDTNYGLAEKGFDLKKFYEDYNLETLKKYDLKDEIEWLKKSILETKSPVCFTHNDFRGSNIMVKEIENNNVSEDNLIICDFEYSSYGFRGMDFGTIFAEWDKNFFDFFKAQEFPDDSKLAQFFESYIKESTKIHGEKFKTLKINTIEHLIYETKVFVLAAQMFLITLIIKSDKSFDEKVEFDKKQSMQMCEMSYKNYHAQKNKFIRDKVFPINAELLN